MEIEDLIEILETDTLSFDFSHNGLVFLSLNNNSGSEKIDLRNFNMEKEQDPMKILIINETIKFLETGSHNMLLDLSNFTPFQQSVLNNIRQIVPGNIFTYKEVAEMIGNPGAAQAVGSATAKNPVSYFIPTHRVLPKNGIPRCKSGAGHLRDKLLVLEGHDIEKLRGNNLCKREKCISAKNSIVNKL